MEENKCITTQQEMEALGIEPRHFDIFYDQLKESKKLPSGDIVPWKQYTTIVDYLRDKLVLGEDNKIQPDGMKVFDSKRRLEAMLDFDDLPSLDNMRSSGGIAPCTYESKTYKSKSSGGVAPCRY